MSRSDDTPDWVDFAAAPYWTMPMVCWHLKRVFGDTVLIDVIETDHDQRTMRVQYREDRDGERRLWEIRINRR